MADIGATLIPARPLLVGGRAEQTREGSIAVEAMLHLGPLFHTVYSYTILKCGIFLALKGERIRMSDLQSGITDVITSTKGNPVRRALLLDAAQRILERKNIVDTTVDDIVQEAGVARGTFYIYFKDKYDILEALSRHVNNKLFDRSHIQLDRSTPPFERIRASLRTVLETWTEHAGLFRSTTQMALSRPDFLALNQELRMPFIRQIRNDLEKRAARGHGRSVDSAITAKALAAMMDWICLLWFGLGEEPYEHASADLDHVADQLARIWYRAIYAADPPESTDSR